MINLTHRHVRLTRRIVFLICLFSLAWPAVPVTRTPAQEVLNVGPRDNYERGSQVRIGTMTQEYHERLRAQFKRGRELLLKKGVPFEPNDLLEPDFRKKLKPKFAQMREMHETRVIRQGQVKGVQLADTLYLPEKVELTGDTVILANQVIFEGRHAVLKGNHAVFFFPVDIDGLLGTTLEVAISEQAGPRFSLASYRNKSKAGSLLPPHWFVPQLMKTDWSITIDTSGQGAEEWQEKQKRKKLAKVGFVKSTSQDLMNDGDTKDSSGDAGATGATGPMGLPTCDGQPDTAPNGDDGSCQLGDPHGKTGFTGANGCTGTTGLVGHPGNPGGDAEPLVAKTNNTSGEYRLFAKGGRGGQGGRVALSVLKVARVASLARQRS